MRGLRVIRKIRHLYLLLSQADPNTVNAKVFSWGFFRLPMDVFSSLFAVSNNRSPNLWFTIHLPNSTSLNKSSLGHGKFPHHRTVRACWT